MICQECGMEIEENEYHPYAFCILVEAGLNPSSVVLEAANQLTTTAPDGLTAEEVARYRCQYRKLQAKIVAENARR